MTYHFVVFGIDETDRIRQNLVITIPQFSEIQMYIYQKQLGNLERLITPGKVIVLYGERRVGKTTLLNKYLEKTNLKTLFVKGDDVVVRQYLESQSINRLRDFVGDHTLLVVDEAQNIRE